MYCLTPKTVTVFSFIFLLLSPLTLISATTSKRHDEDQTLLQQVCEKLNLDEDQCCKLGKTSSFIAYASAAVAAGAVGVPAVLCYMGFTATGITAGSWAAWYQATYGIGTVFSYLQSVSVTGALVAPVTKVGIGIAAIKSFVFGGDCKKKSTQDDKCAKN
ncbi:unnamed protein product [Adineta ricciae]|uniref:Uncharacterized protein n=1 Tax=Adineta ricciae TaxID=249248 RepID=A0A815W4L1_ADIRI|nr:unnamed protein product [Adineta ricciae]CAF1538581.1 unnamed protein product [Adineta ricciae]